MGKLGRVALVLCLTILTISCTASGAVGGATLGFALNGLLNKVGNLITAAQNAGNMLEVGAGGQILAGIGYAQASYEHELDVTLDRLTIQEKKTLDDLTTQVGYLENHAVAQLKEIVDRGTLIANSVPFSKTLPQVSRYSPYYIVPGLGNDTLLSIDGNFFDSAREGYAPTLTVQNTVLPEIIGTTLNLAFKIPSNLLQQSGAGLTFIAAHLDIPYQASCFLIFSCKKQTTFQFLLVALPANPGQLEFITLQNVDTTETKSVTSPLPPNEFSQDSSDNDIPDPIGVGFQHCWQPDPGWRVVPASVRHIVTWSQGDEGSGNDWWWNNNTSNGLNACWNLTTIHHYFGTSGKVRFYLAFTEERVVRKPQQRSTVDALRWGSTKSYSIPGDATWRAVYQEFDGRRIDIISAAFDNPYLHVATSGNNISFETIH